jgi:hypothetical protein
MHSDYFLARELYSFRHARGTLTVNIDGALPTTPQPSTCLTRINPALLSLYAMLSFESLLWPHHGAGLQLLLFVLVLACLALVFYGSYATRYVLIALFSSVALVAFYVTAVALLRFLPRVPASVTAIIIATIAAVSAGRAASAGVLTVPVLGFAFGVVVAGIVDVAGARFAATFPSAPVLGFVSSRVCFGAAFARIALLFPSHAAAASTALCGARGFTLCVAALSRSNISPQVHVPITVGLGIAGYVTQAFLVPKWARYDVEGRVVEAPELPYQRI